MGNLCEDEAEMAAKMRAMNEVADLALKANGVIYGGYVRDMIRKNHFCDKYYKEGNDVSDFADKDTSPETVDRLIIPGDVDIFFKNGVAMQAYFAVLNKRGYRVNMCPTSGGYEQVKAKVTLDVGRLIRHLRKLVPPALRQSVHLSVEHENVVVDLDITMGDTLDLSDLDFDVNGLIMDGDDIALCDLLHKKQKNPISRMNELIKIREHIIEHKAVCMNFVAHRYTKMLDKGWEVCGAPVEKVGDVEAQCLICHEVNATWRLSCCSAAYHTDCGFTLINDIRYAEVCCHCRRENEKMQDIKEVLRLSLAPEEVE
jgi:hypothetical protein